jgi:hypothetical protein
MLFMSKALMRISFMIDFIFRELSVVAYSGDSLSVATSRPFAPFGRNIVVFKGLRSKRCAMSNSLNAQESFLRRDRIAYVADDRAKKGIESEAEFI